jgi:hypothetical protein
MRLYETGIIMQLGNRYIITPEERCKIRNIEAESQEGNALSLLALVSAFLIFGIGVGLSLLVFGIELFVFLIAEQNKRRRTSKPETKLLSKELT